MESAAPTFTAVDYVVFGGCLLVFAGIGLYHAFGQTSSRNVLLGNRDFSIIPMALTVAASFLSAISVLGFPAEIYTFGTMYYWYGVMYCIAFPVSAFVLLPTIYRLKLTSAYQYLELRFSPSVRRLTSLIFSLQVMLYLAVVLYAPSLALSQVTPLSTYTSMLLTGVLATFYTSLGGAKAVVYTSMLQMLLLLAGLCVVAVIGCGAVGSPADVWQINVAGHRAHFTDFRPDPTVRHSFWSLVVGGCFMIWALFSANQMTVQRYISMPTLRAAQSLILLNIPFNLLALTLYSALGLLMYATYALCDPLNNGLIRATDQLLPYYVMNRMSHLPGVPGLFVCAVYSAGLSTLSGGMNSLTAVFFEDLFKPLYAAVTGHELTASAKQGASMTRCLCLMIGVCVVALAFLFSVLQSTILQLSMTIFGVFGGPPLGAFTAGLLLPFATSTGALAGLVVSCVTNCVLGFGAFVRATRYIPIGHVNVTALTNATTSCLFANSTSQTLNLLQSFERPELYNRVRAADGETSGVFQVSYQFYTMAGVAVFWLVCTGVSLLTRHRERRCGPELLSPVWHSFYAYEHVDEEEKQDDSSLIGKEMTEDVNKNLMKAEA